MKGYSYESCPMEYSAGGTLLYISNHLSYKHRNDLCTYKSTELGSTFIETLHRKSYRYHHMDLNEFNNYYVNNLLDKFSQEIKTFILGDFNIDLLNYDQHSLTIEFLDCLSSHVLLPNIVQPTKNKK